MLKGFYHIHCTWCVYTCLCYTHTLSLLMTHYHARKVQISVVVVQRKEAKVGSLLTLDTSMFVHIQGLLVGLANYTVN